jgi:hypothetical protein
MKLLTIGIKIPATLLLLFSAFFFLGCKKQTVTLPSEPISDFLPLQMGKYIIYRTDSTVFTNSGTSMEIHSYEEKQIIDSQFNDNLGRSSYRISTYLRDTLETQPWISSQIYFITPTDKTDEVIENNRIWEKLALPINTGYTWKGNHYLLNNIYSDAYNFSNDDDINTWPYTYSNLDTTLILNGQTILHVLEVNGVNQETNLPLTNLNGYAALNFMQEFYAKGIGLVSQELVMWEYQPPPSRNGSFGYKEGFGVKRTMLTHN